MPVYRGWIRVEGSRGHGLGCQGSGLICELREGSSTVSDADLIMFTL